MSYIEVQGLSKNYRVQKREKQAQSHGLLRLFYKRHYEQVEAIRKIDFSVDRGQIVGFIGPNGAGKSTTIKLLSGILIPDEGSCVINGMIPWENRKKYVREIGVMFGQRSQLLWDLPLTDSFSLLKGIYNIADEEYIETLNMLTSMLNLGELLHKPVRQLSLGQRMRCELAATFIHKPKLVFLDEPTIGIDIEAKKQFHEFVKVINKWIGTTIIITTHDLDDIKSLCNKLLIINKGQIYYDGTLEDLYKKHPMSGRIYVEAEDTFNLNLPTYATISKNDGTSAMIEIDASIDTGIAVNDIAHNNNINKIHAEKLQIEDVILNIYRKFMKE